MDRRHVFEYLYYVLLVAATGAALRPPDPRPWLVWVARVQVFHPFSNPRPCAYRQLLLASQNRAPTHKTAHHRLWRHGGCSCGRGPRCLSVLPLCPWRPDGADQRLATGGDAKHRAPARTQWQPQWRQMHGSAIVPHHEVILCPPMRHQQVWLCRVLSQHLHQALALLRRQAHDPHHRERRDEQHSLARLLPGTARAGWVRQTSHNLLLAGANSHTNNTRARAHRLHRDQRVLRRQLIEIVECPQTLDLPLHR
jgi:hypothetical protein